MNRRHFIKNSFLFTAGSLLAAPVLARRPSSEIVTILYTNDTHARIDPFPSNAVEYAGLGGISRRATLIRRIREQSPNTLLLDAGDVFQGTTWFNVFGGEKDLKLMTKLGYDAGCIGNHEFDNGPDGFAEVASAADFPFLCANYDFRNTPMNPYVRRFIILEKRGIRFGIFGLGIRLDGVVRKELYGDVQHRDPVIWANGMVRSLTQYHNCDYVICLSHLGYHYHDNRMDDRKLASQVNGIDLIIGGHTHTFLDQPEEIQNPDGGTTLVTQAGHSGIKLGRIDIHFDGSGTPNHSIAHQYEIGPDIEV